jgi:lipoate-protein ligase A
LFGASLHETYMKINAALLEFLKDLGLDADISDGESREEARGMVCFKSAGKHEISVKGRKLIGSAQRRRGEVFLQHGSILAGPRHLDLIGFLGERADRAQLAAATTDLGQLLGKPLDPADLDAFAPALANSFGRVLNLETVWLDRTGRS